MISFPLPLLGFAAFSGTGKTTLLCEIIPLLKEKGFHIGVIKHSHHDIEIDHPKKDTFALRKSGAEKVLISSQKRTALIIEHSDKTTESTLEEALKDIHPEGLDLVLIEGFKHADIPKIELHRKALNKPYIYLDDKNIIAVATDHELADENAPYKLDLNQPVQIANYIVENMINEHSNKK